MSRGEIDFLGLICIGIDLDSVTHWAYNGPMTEKRRHGAALRLRLLPEHDALIRAAAERAGVSISDWMRDRLIRTAREELGPELSAAAEGRAAADRPESGDGA